MTWIEKVGNVSILESLTPGGSVYFNCTLSGHNHVDPEHLRKYIYIYSKFNLNVREKTIRKW